MILRFILILMIISLPIRDYSVIQIYTIRFFDLLAFTFMLAFWASKLYLGKKIRYNKAVFYYVALFFASQILYAILGLFNGGSQNIIVREIVWTAFYLAFFLSLISYLLTLGSENFIRKMFRLSLNAFFYYHLVLMVLYYVLNVQLSLWSDNNTLIWRIANIDVKRFSGLASEPGFLISMMIFPLTIAIVSLYDAGLKRYFELGYFKITVIIISCLLSFSSFGYLSIMLIFLVIMLINRKNLFRKISLVILVGVLFLATYFTVPTFKAFITATGEKVSFNSDSYSARERSNWRAIAIDMFGDNPVVGWGIGTYSSNMADFASNMSINVRHAEQANSVYWLLLAERGLVGFSIFVMFIYGLIKPFRLALKLKIKQPQRALYLSIFTAILIQYTHWAITGVIWLYYFWFYLAISLSLLFIVSDKKRNEQLVPKMYGGG